MLQNIKHLAQDVYIKRGKDNSITIIISLPPTFSSLIGSEEGPESFELHICVKDYCFARDDRLVGVAVLQLRDIVDQVTLDLIVYIIGLNFKQFGIRRCYITYTFVFVSVILFNILLLYLENTLLRLVMV